MFSASSDPDPERKRANEGATYVDMSNHFYETFVPFGGWCSNKTPETLLSNAFCMYRILTSVVSHHFVLFKNPIHVRD